jgi:hypothetical protein
MGLLDRMLRQQMNQRRYGRPRSLWGAPPPRRSPFRGPPRRPPGLFGMSPRRPPGAFGYPRMRRSSGVRVYGCCLPIPLGVITAGALGVAAYARGRG